MLTACEKVRVLMSIENAEKIAPALPGLAIEASTHANTVGTIAPYRTLNQIIRGLIAAAIMGMWAVTLVSGIFLVRPDTSQPSGIVMVLAVPILLVSALPIVYRYWVKNWRTM